MHRWLDPIACGFGVSTQAGTEVPACQVGSWQLLSRWWAAICRLPGWPAFGKAGRKPAGFGYLDLGSL